MQALFQNLDDNPGLCYHIYVDLLDWVMFMERKELNHSQVLRLLPEREPHTHKGNYGRILLLCGSRGYTGAAALAAMGALRCGAGLVYLGVPESIYGIEAAKLTEPVIFPLPDSGGMYAESAAEEVALKLQNMDAVLIGPGMGMSPGTSLVLKTVLQDFSGPVVLDADGINLLPEHIDLLRGRTGQTVLTPHDGEFKRVGGVVSLDRVESARKFAEQTNTILLLKGHRTVITDGKICYINTTGNPGMAVGGSGDVLAGMITALIGQGIAPIEAAACGAWLHGATGDICAAEIGQYGMLPTDMLQVLPRLLK